MRFNDHFSRSSPNYRTFRPTYPPALFCALHERCVRSDLAWDCATGTGQAAVGLAQYFARVCATDASANQLANATPHERVEYSPGPAEHSALSDASVDLVTVAQALHWFDIDAFASEVQRVLRPAGVLAAWTYNLFRITTDIDRCIGALYDDVLQPFWPPERRLVENGYADIVLPLHEETAPSVSMHADWDLATVLGYVATWSAIARCRDATGQNPLEAFALSLERAWGDPSLVRRITWPLTIRIWRQPARV